MGTESPSFPPPRLSEEVAANFRAWYERNFVNARAGRIGRVSYDRAGALDERPGDGVWYAEAYERALVDHTEPLRADEFGFLLGNPLVALQLALGVTDLRGLRCLRRGLTEEINDLQAKSYRSRYYARDNARRRLLAAERRRITRRTTLNPCPTPAAFREAFARRAESVEARIRFGGLVHDLECYVDNCLRIDARGEIVGRNGGVKAWIAGNVPELSCRYKTIMRYKALAKRVRQLAEIRDPVPTDALLSPDAPADADATPDAPARAGQAPRGGAREATSPRREDAGRSARRGKNYYAVKSHERGASGRDAGFPLERKRLEAARRRVRAAIEGCENTLKAVFARME